MPFILGRTVTETFQRRAEKTPDRIGFQYRLPGSQQWKQVTFREFYDECKTISFGLIALGIRPGDKVAILSNTRIEWSLSDMAILGARAITVPIYASSSREDVAYLIAHSEAKAIFVENSVQLERIRQHRQQDPKAFPSLEKIVFFQSEGEPPSEGWVQVLSLEALKKLLDAEPEDLITICYTSGTTGTPKGVMITHDNMMSVLGDCVEAIGRFVKPEAEVVLSFLPFSHILGKVESMAIHTFGWREAFAESQENFIHDMAQVRPTIIFAVPRFFEKAYARIQATVDTGSLTKKVLFTAAVEAGRKYYSALWKRELPKAKDAAQYLLAKEVVLKSVLERFGGKLRFAISGGAPLPREIGEFFHIVGVKVLEGYGLTETCAPVTLNTPDDVRYGTVGRPLPEVDIKIAEDGEILIKSRKVFQGYYKMPEETSDAFSGGWFHTGDIGYIDDDGFLHITDRKKDLIITSAGKNIAPQKIENMAKSYKLLSQFVVHGDRRNYLTALVTLNRDEVVKYATENQMLFSEYAELIKKPKIIALVQRAVDEMNRRLASFETIKKFIIVPEDFTIEGGELTPSLKVRRKQIARKYRSELDSLYAEDRPLD